MASPAVSSVTDRTVVLAAPRAFCAGVERAIAIVWRALAQRGAPVFVRKQIVHNAHVVAELAAAGAAFVEELDEVPDGATVVFSAHGVAPAVRAEAARRGLSVIDATCPLVSKVHGEARRLLRDGVQVVLIGHAGHEEVEGVLGHAPPGAIRLVQSPEEAADVEIDQPGRVAYLTQTTLAVDETARTVAALRMKYPQLTGPPSDDICYASTNRQRAVSAIAAETDLVLVVGSVNSHNTSRLVDIVRRTGTPAYLIEDASEIRAEWLEGARTIGLTAGASAPPRLVEEVVDALRAHGHVDVVERSVGTEKVHFGLHAQVRSS